ncbi:hypothetical protein BC834DRAFT_866691 [Gloeopeniophorella convolvens]|nr:hypothetical protein BC834DRAFT_866691 [Gloeopeniophorella convolvens]
MSPPPSPGRSSLYLQPSLPPSPQEEDLGRRAAWSHSDDELDRESTSSFDHPQQRKGKQRAVETQSPPPASYAEGGTDEALEWASRGGNTEAYPPTTDEETESRRIQENLRRWEIAERQRRRAARDSTVSNSPSVVAGVARRATSFWTRRTSHPPADGGGKHHALQTSEDAVQLDDIEASPSPSAPPSPSPSPALGHLRTGPYARTENPFADPPGSSSSLFVNAQAVSTPLDASASAVELQAPVAAAATPSSPSETLAVSDSGISLSTSVVSPPAPLDLPKPRSPPPRTETPHAKRPPEPFPRPDSALSRPIADDEDAKPVRWWTEWLCGCSEGQDRGGEVQAGRTNPLE